MAKVCCNCKKSMGLLEKGLKLSSVDAVLCGDCGKKAAVLQPFLENQDYIGSVDKHRTLESDFMMKLADTELATDAKRLIRKNFQLKQIAKSKVTVTIRSFEGDFAWCYNAIKKAGEKVLGEEPSANIITLGESRSATFLMVKVPFGLGGDTLTMLAVTLVHCGGKAIVTAKGASDYFGNFHSLNYDFWRAFELQNPNLDVTDIWKLDYNPALNTEGADSHEQN